MRRAGRHLKAGISNDARSQPSDYGDALARGALNPRMSVMNRVAVKRARLVWVG